jgi:hypothetical protein
LSPHESWYHYPDGQNESTGDDEIEREEIETTARNGGSVAIAGCKSRPT